jgi:phosphatidylglycerophosphate synthase
MLPPNPARDRPRPGAPASASARVWAQLRRLPNQLSLLRLAAVPVLWALALMGRPWWVGVGAALAASTDVLDGYLSRKWNQTSTFGSRLDSAADHLLTISMVAWLALLRPEFYREERVPLLAWSAFALFVLAVSWLKFRRFVDLHLWSAKAAVFLSFLFAVPLLATGWYSRAQFYLTLGVATFAAAEALYVVLTRDRVDEHLGSVLLRRKK